MASSRAARRPASQRVSLPSRRSGPGGIRSWGFQCRTHVDVCVVRSMHMNIHVYLYMHTCATFVYIYLSIYPSICLQDDGKLNDGDCGAETALQPEAEGCKLSLCKTQFRKEGTFQQLDGHSDAILLRNRHMKLWLLDRHARNLSALR